jgi:hypothetical protein
LLKVFGVSLAAVAFVVGCGGSERREAPSAEAAVVEQVVEEVVVDEQPEYAGDTSPEEAAPADDKPEE